MNAAETKIAPINAIDKQLILKQDILLNAF